MQVLVDTSVWFLSLRRRALDLNEAERRIADELAELVKEGRAELVGFIRQELLSGIRSREQFEKLRHRLRAFADEPISIEDYERAAQANNECRGIGISGSAVDFLICAISLQRGWSIFTADADFINYSKVLPLDLHVPRG